MKTRFKIYIAISFMALTGLGNAAFSQNQQDRIFLVNRTELKGRIVEIRDLVVVYNSAENLPGTTREIRKTSIWKIIYSNGFEELFNDPLPEEILKSSQEENRQFYQVGEEKKSESLKEDQKENTVLDTSVQEIEAPYYSILFDEPLDRSRISLYASLYGSYVSGASSWTSKEITRGLGLSYGVGTELGVEFAPREFVSVNINAGYSYHSSLWKFNDTTRLDIRYSLHVIPLTARAKFFPLKDVFFHFGVNGNFMLLNNSTRRGNRESGINFGLTGGLGYEPVINGQRFETSINFNSVVLSNNSFGLEATQLRRLGTLHSVNLKIGIFLGN